MRVNIFPSNQGLVRLDWKAAAGLIGDSVHPKGCSLSISHDVGFLELTRVQRQRLPNKLCPTEHAASDVSGAY